MGTKTHLTNTQFSCVIFKTFNLIYLPDYKLNVWSLQKVSKIFIKMQRGKSPSTPKTPPRGNFLAYQIPMGLSQLEQNADIFKN